MRVISNVLLFILILITVYWIWTSQDARDLWRDLKDGGSGAVGAAVDGAGRALCKAWGC